MILCFLRRIIHFFNNRQRIPDGIRVCIGLGNPGPEYAGTRHNLGADMLSCFRDDSRKLSQFSLRFSNGTLIEKNGSKSIVFIPTTYMNHSGRAVKEICEFMSHHCENFDYIVMYDDLDLPLGKLRYRKKGGPGGHNGIKSIIEETGTKDFYRLRLGIGNENSGRIPDFVLSRFDEGELPLARNLSALVHESLECFINHGIDRAMTDFNGKQAST